MCGPIQLEGYNTQLAAIVQSVLAVRENGHNDASGAGTSGSWLQNGSSGSTRHDPSEIHRLRESLLAHLSQLQTLLFLDEPSVFLQSLVKNVPASHKSPLPTRNKPWLHERLLIRGMDRLRFWHASAGLRSSKYLHVFPGEGAYPRGIYVS